MAWNDFLKSPQWQGGAPGILNYGIDTLANKFNNYAGSNDRLDYDQGLSEWGSPMGNVPDAPSMPPMLDQTGQMGASNYRGTFPGSAYSPHRGFEEMQFDETVQAPDERTGILENLKTKLSGFTTPAMAFMKKMGGVTPEKKAFYDAIVGDRPLRTGQWTKGMYGGNEYEVANTRGGLKVGSDIIGKGPGYEKNLYSAFGSKSIEEMEQKKLDWFRDRVRKGKKISQRGYDLIDKYGDGQTDTGTPAQTDRQKIEAYTGRGMSDYRASRPASERQFTGHGRSGMGRSADRFAAEGGRIGYQEGLLVDEDVNIEGPGFDVNENVMMASAPDPMAELEAFSLEIFKKSFEQLNDTERDILFDMLNDQAGMDPSEGIASLV